MSQSLLNHEKWKLNFEQFYKMTSLKCSDKKSLNKPVIHLFQVSLTVITKKKTLILNLIIFWRQLRILNDIFI